MAGTIAWRQKRRTDWHLSAASTDEARACPLTMGRSVPLATATETARQGLPRKLLRPPTTNPGARPAFTDLESNRRPRRFRTDRADQT